MQRHMLLLLVLMVGMMAAAPALADDLAATPTPDPQAVLNRAEEVADLAERTAALAEAAAEQNVRTIELVRNLAWFFGILIGIASVALGLYGFNTQRGFQDSMREYREQLTQMQAAHQAATERYQAQQADAQNLASEMTAHVQEIKTLREELTQIKESVTAEFTAAKQALVLLGMGNRLFNAGKRDQAIDIYGEARRLQPDDAQINYRLGRAYSNAGRYEEAIEALEKAVYAKPTLAEAHMELGLTYRRHAEQVPTAEERKAEYRLAERFLLRAVDLRCDYEDALGALGGLCRREGRYADALDFYRKAGRVDPHSSYAWNNIASLSWYLGDIEYARTAFERVERIATERIESGMEEAYWDYYDRALARLVLGRREEAIADHCAAINNTPEEENFRSVLDNLRFLERADEDIEGLDEFISMVEERL
jgi:tetratricopeptide (TPR) repeat protein